MEDKAYRWGQIPPADNNLAGHAPGTCGGGELSSTGVKRGFGRGFEPVGLAPAEKELLSRMPRALALEGPRIYQPGSGGMSVIVPFDDVRPRDPYVLGAIEILAYISELNGFLDSASMASMAADRLPPIPQQVLEPLPIQPYGSPFSAPTTLAEQVRRHQNNTETKTEEEDKEQVFKTETPSLSEHVVYNILHRSAATLAAFVGYDSSTDAALDLLTSSAALYLTNLCSLLRMNRDRQLLSSSSAAKKNLDPDDLGFPDVLDRTIREMNRGGGGIRQLPLYYRHSVVGRYHGIVNKSRLLLRECQHKISLSAAYPNMSSGLMPQQQFPQHQFQQQQLQQQIHQQQLDGNNHLGTATILAVPVHHHLTAGVAKVEVMTGAGDEDASSSNVPTFSLDHNTPQIESGLQMLQSLEQGVLVPADYQQPAQLPQLPQLKPLDTAAQSSPAFPPPGSLPL